MFNIGHAYMTCSNPLDYIIILEVYILNFMFVVVDYWIAAGGFVFLCFILFFIFLYL